MGKHEHERRDDLASEHPYCDKVQTIYIIVFLAIWGLDSFVFQFSTFLGDFIPSTIRYITFGIIFAVAIYLVYQAHKIVFQERRDPPVVIRKGVFARTRHPMYLGAILFYISAFFVSLSLLSLPMIAIIVILYNSFANYEERKLAERFGNEYVQYKDATPKWLFI